MFHIRIYIEIIYKKKNAIKNQHIPIDTFVPYYWILSIDIYFLKTWRIAKGSEPLLLLHTWHTTYCKIVYFTESWAWPYLITLYFIIIYFKVNINSKLSEKKYFSLHIICTCAVVPTFYFYQIPINLWISCCFWILSVINLNVNALKVQK